MHINFIGISRDDVRQLAERLESESYPESCNILLINYLSSDGCVKNQQIRLELILGHPGVLLPLHSPSDLIDLAVNELIGLAREFDGNSK